MKGFSLPMHGNIYNLDGSSSTIYSIQLQYHLILTSTRSCFIRELSCLYLIDVNYSAHLHYLSELAEELLQVCPMFI